MTLTLAPEPSSEKLPRRALILAGGGMRVSYQAGVLLALEQAGLTFHHGDGTSGGTMNLAMLLSGLTPEQMCERWRTLCLSDFISFMPPGEYLKASGMQGMGDGDGILKKVFPHLGIDTAKINRAQGLQGTFNVCNVATKTNHAIEHQNITSNLLLAGISLPIFMPPVEDNGQQYIDSVWIKDANLMEAVRRGAEEIWLVWCIGNTPVYHDGAFNQYVHMIEMSANGVLFEEFQWINEINARIEKGESAYGQRQPIKLHVIKPEHELPLDPDLFFNRIDNATLIDMGYADAKRYLSTQNNAGVSIKPDATTMRALDSAILLRERYHHINNADTLKLHLALHIHDIDAFIKDPKHEARLTGHFSSKEYGENIVLENGQFYTQVLEGDVPGKQLHYRFQFSHNQQTFILHAQKILKDDPGIDIFSDIATLHYEILQQYIAEEGDGKIDKVIATGKARIQISGINDIFASAHPLRAKSVTDSAGTMSKLGRFFLGELYQQYFKPKQKAWWRFWES